MSTNFTALIPEVVAIGACYKGTYKVFSFVEDRLSNDRKHDVSELIKVAKPNLSNKLFVSSLSDFHSDLFGSKQASYLCIYRTTVLSLLSFIFVMFGHAIKYFADTERMNFETIIIVLPLVFITIVLPIDFAGVEATRLVLRWLKNSRATIAVSVAFFIDLIVKSILLPIAFVIFFAILLYLVPGLLVAVFQQPSYTIPYEAAVLFIPYAYINLLPAFVLCSIWVWLYAAGLNIIRLGFFVLDIEKQPVRSIGLLVSVFITFFYALYLFFVTILTQMSMLSYGRIIASRNNFGCGRENHTVRRNLELTY
jgi:hypothetical protein